MYSQCGLGARRGALLSPLGLPRLLGRSAAAVRVWRRREGRRVGAPRADRLSQASAPRASGSASLAVGIVAVSPQGRCLRRETSLFAVRTIESRAHRQMKAECAALGPARGGSLLKVNGEIDGRVAGVSTCARWLRRLPHTLRIVVGKRAVLLLRRGSDAWAVSARGRILRAIRNPGRSSLPRVWVPADTIVTIGDRLPPAAGGRAAAVLAVARGSMLAQVRFVRVDGHELALVLRSGLEVRLRGTDEAAQAHDRPADPDDAGHVGDRRLPRRQRPGAAGRRRRRTSSREYRLRMS